MNVWRVSLNQERLTGVFFTCNFCGTVVMKSKDVLGFVTLTCSDADFADNSVNLALINQRRKLKGLLTRSGKQINAAFNEGLGRVECEISDDSSPYFLCKYLSLECSRCRSTVGKLIVSAPVNISPLLDQVIVDLK